MSTNQRQSDGSLKRIAGLGSYVVDSALSDTSTNPVQNKVIKSELDNKIDASKIGVVNGIAELDSSGKVPSSQLPSYVDDIIEGYYNEDDGKFYKESTYVTEIAGESGKIYVAIDTNLPYRWTGSAFVVIPWGLALGETSSTAYRGDRGKAAYDHATDSDKITTAQTSKLYKVAVTKEGHIASVTEVQKSDITALGIPAQDTTYSEATTSTAGLMSASDKTKLNNAKAQYYQTAEPTGATVGDVWIG